MPDKPWKVEERKKCRALGGERSGPTGRDTPDCDDAVHVALEVKHYKKYVFLTEDWNQAVENAAKAGKVPVLNVRERGRGGRDCVQMRSADYRELFGPIFHRIPRDDIYPFYIHRLGPDLIRIPWQAFLWLYKHTFNNDKEN